MGASSSGSLGTSSSWDTWVASEVALPLTRAVTSAGVGVFRVRAEPFCAFWRVWWLHPAREEEHYFEVKERDVGIARVRTRYESTRTDSPFNARACSHGKT